MPLTVPNVNKVVSQTLKVYHTRLKRFIRRPGESEFYKVPHYYLELRSDHGDGKTAIVSIEIPKGTFTALIQDHGAKRVGENEIS